MKNRVIALIVAAVVVVAGGSAYVLLLPALPSSPTHVVHSSANCTSSSASARGNLTNGNWTSYHGNNSRTGDESMAAITTVDPSWATPTPLNGQVYAEPLVCGDTVFVATEGDTVYAINASSGAVRWQTNLGPPVPGSSLPCGDISPSGITGTPVIDPATGMLYVVAFLDLNPIRHVLFGLNIENGSIDSRVGVDPANATVDAEQQRGALALANGYVYVPYGGLYGDCGSYHGWVVGVSATGAGAEINYQVPSGKEGGIWGASGITVAPSGDLYVATGNSGATTTFDFGDAVIELSPALKELQYFAPTDWMYLNSNDVDLGTVAPAMLPNGDIFQVGKEGIGYLLSGAHLGGIGGQIYNATVCASAYGGTARVGQAILVPCIDGVFKEIVGATNFTEAWQTPNFDAGVPIATNDLVWAVNISTSYLMGFNLSNGHEVYAFPMDGADHFITPAAAPGALFVAGGSELYAFSLK